MSDPGKGGRFLTACMAAGLAEGPSGWKKSMRQTVIDLGRGIWGWDVESSAETGC